MPGSELAEGKGQAILEGMPDFWSILKAHVIGPHLFHFPGSIECFYQQRNNVRIAPGSQDERTFPSVDAYTIRNQRPLTSHLWVDKRLETLPVFLLLPRSRRAGSRENHPAKEFARREKRALLCAYPVQWRWPSAL